MFREALPPFYRKVALNGRPSCDTEPNRHKRTDIEAEKSCVDALTLQVWHQTTDVYVPLLGTEFALGVRRSHVALAWQADAGLSPGQRPDLPFGGCWTTGVTANVHAIDRGDDQPVEMLVTDEQGTVHAFVELFQNGRPVGFYPLPNNAADQDGRALSLVREGGQFVLRRKFGIVLTFDAAAPAVEIAVDGADHGKELHRYYRLRQARHNRGGYLRYHFEASNAGLVPDEITFAKKRLRFLGNAQGQVAQVIDPRGNVHRYEYRPAGVAGGAPLLVRQYRPPVRGEAPCTSYEYEESGSTGSLSYAAIALIADPLGNTYRFRHRPGEGPDAPLPRVSEIDLPGGLGTARFQAYAGRDAEQRGTTRRFTFIADAVGNGILYDFSERVKAALAGLPWRRGGNGQAEVTLGGWLRQEISYFERAGHSFDEKSGKIQPHLRTRRLLRERYEFDAGSGFGLAKAIDTEGNVSSFAYKDPLRRPQLESVLAKDFRDPIAQFCRDVTEAVNPLGGIRRLVYHPTNRVVVRREDELGHLTVFEVDDPTGLDFSETVYADAAAEKAGKPFVRTEWEFKHADFPGFVTRKIVRKTGAQPESPEWEKDLTSLYEADENGNVIKETADPEGRKLVWNYEYGEHNNKLATFYPDGYCVQFRYDPLNRLDRVYRPHNAVKKSWFDARGNRVRELEPNGDLTESTFDSMARVVRTREEKGKVDARVVTLTETWYNAVNSKTRESAGGSVKTYRFDGVQRVISIRENRKAATMFSYSANGCSNLFRRSSYKCASFYSNVLKRHFIRYDGWQNKLSQFTAPFRWYGTFLRPSQAVTYDVAGNKIEERNGWKMTRYEYDPLHRLTVTFEGNGKWTRVLRTSTRLEYGTLDSTGARKEKRFDSAGYEVTT